MKQRLTERERKLLRRLKRDDGQQGVTVGKANLRAAESLEGDGLALWVDMRTFVVTDKGRNYEL